MEENKDNSKTEENEAAQQVTSTIKKTKPKDPGRVAAGKKLAEHNKKVREAKQRKNNDSETPINPINESKQETSSFSLTQIVSVVSIVVSFVGLYYKREELMRFVKPKKIEREVNEVKESDVSEVNSDKEPKSFVKQMD